MIIFVLKTSFQDFLNWFWTVKLQGGHSQRKVKNPQETSLKSSDLVAQTVGLLSGGVEASVTFEVVGSNLNHYCIHTANNMEDIKSLTTELWTSKQLHDK